jgi:hypothetical protein
MEVNMQSVRFEVPHPLSAAHLKTLHLYPQRSTGTLSAIRNPQSENPQSAREDV